MATKTISVNPDFFGTNTKRKNKTKQKLKHSLRKDFNTLQKNFLKEKLIDKIKDFKKKQKKEDNHTNSSESFKDNYTEAIDFMDDIIKKKQTRKQRKRERKKKKALLEKQEIEKKKHLETNELFKEKTPTKGNITPDPPYGILKNGTKPLYSKYKKSMKSAPKPILAFTDNNNFGKEMDINQKIKDFSVDINVPDFKERQNKLQQVKNNIKKNQTFRIKNKKIKKRFLLGKNKQTRKVGILIKNKKTRRLVNKDFKLLKKKKMKSIKKYLLDHAFIKVGTSAPDNILREMYVNAYLSGDMKNSGGKSAEEIMMHNWDKA
jgi:hypothetical protein